MYGEVALHAERHRIGEKPAALPCLFFLRAVKWMLMLPLRAAAATPADLPLVLAPHPLLSLSSSRLYSNANANEN